MPAGPLLNILKLSITMEMKCEIFPTFNSCYVASVQTEPQPEGCSVHSAEYLQILFMDLANSKIDFYAPDNPGKLDVKLEPSNISMISS